MKDGAVFFEEPAALLNSVSFGDLIAERHGNGQYRLSLVDETMQALPHHGDYWISLDTKTGAKVAEERRVKSASKN